MGDKEMKIIGIEIEDMTLAPAPPHHRARVRFRYDISGNDQVLTANCLCKSTLGPDAAPALVRDDLVRHGLVQLRRMPEVWLDRAQIKLGVAPGEIVRRGPVDLR
jgi:hypothetical protein